MFTGTTLVAAFMMYMDKVTIGQGFLGVFHILCYLFHTIVYSGAAVSTPASYLKIPLWFLVRILAITNNISIILLSQHRQISNGS
jgi:hypothetical protein